jgi:hypothetical protein
MTLGYLMGPNQGKLLSENKLQQETFGRYKGLVSEWQLRDLRPGKCTVVETRFEKRKTHDIRPMRLKISPT